MYSIGTSMLVKIQRKTCNVSLKRPQPVAWKIQSLIGWDWLRRDHWRSSPSIVWQFSQTYSHLIFWKLDTLRPLDDFEEQLRFLRRPVKVSSLICESHCVTSWEPLSLVPYQQKADFRPHAQWLSNMHCPLRSHPDRHVEQVSIMNSVNWWSWP